MMAKLPVYKIDGSQSSEIEVNPLVFENQINTRLLQLVLKAYAGNQRRGTHDTKERKEVSGGGKKPWRQKGTGRARQGSIRAPQWRGGGTVFGPTPRDYDTNLPEMVRKKALISAFSLRKKESQIMLLEDLQLGEAKTKELKRAINVLNLGSVRTLLVVASCDEKLKRASQNLKELFSIKRANDVNAYDVLRRKRLVISKSALPILEKRVLEESQLSGTKELVAT